MNFLIGSFCRWAELCCFIFEEVRIKCFVQIQEEKESRNFTVHFRCFETWNIFKESRKIGCVFAWQGYIT